MFCLIGRDVDGYSSTFGAFQCLGLSDPQSEQLAQGDLLGEWTDLRYGVQAIGPNN